MRVLGVAGWSGAGKTTLIEAMLPLLRADGVRVSTIKRTHHEVDLDRPGKDSFRHRAAGAAEVMVVSDRRWALLAETAEPATLEALLARMTPVDLVLVEGFRFGKLPRIEVHRPALGKPPLWPGQVDILAVATDAVELACDRPVLPLADPAAIVAWLRQRLEIRHTQDRRTPFAP